MYDYCDLILAPIPYAMAYFAALMGVRPRFRSGSRLVLKPVRGRERAYDLIAIWPPKD